MQKTYLFQAALLGATTAATLLHFGGCVQAAPSQTAKVNPAQTAASEIHAPIPIRFTLPEAGYATIVIEDATGKRIRNLVGETAFPAGENVVWWDGTDESTGVREDGDGIWSATGRLVAPGAYRARGIWHKGVDLKYEFAVYTNGNPPWRTPDGSGRWMADHTPPRDVLFLPGRKAGDAGQMLIASYVAEAGDGLVWTDLQGRKTQGLRWIGGNWTGAAHLSRDSGAGADASVAAYAASSWVAGGNNSDPNAKGELRLTALSSESRKKDRSVLIHRFDRSDAAKQGVGAIGISNDGSKAFVSGLSSHNGILAVSLFRHEQLMFVDARAGKILATAKLPDVGAVAYDSQGRLLVIVGKQLRRYTLPALPKDGGEFVLPPAQILPLAGLDAPNRVTLDGKDNIYISDWGRSHQVKVFTPDGKFVRAIGTAGGAQVGPYDKTRMNNPAGVTISSDGQIWVAEESFTPKRVSIWTPQGGFVKGLYGPSRYGGGGNLSPDKKSFYYYDHAGMRFALDWNRGSWELADIYYQPQAGDLILAGGGPQLPLSFGGRQYLTNTYNSGIGTSGAAVAGLWLMKNGRAVPVAAMGNAYEWKLLSSDAYKAAWPKGINLEQAAKSRIYQDNNPVLFAWSDRNGDAQMQAEEITWQRVKNRVGTVFISPELEATTTLSYVLNPQSFTGAGVPIYDAATAKPRVTDPIGVHYAQGHDVIVAGNRVVVMGKSVKGYLDGKLQWTYPNNWPSLHEGHNAPPQQYPGQLIATTKTLGLPVSPRGSEAEPIWAYNGDAGPIYLMTTDGLFVAQLFQDGRKPKTKRWDEFSSKRGTVLNTASKHGEDFWPTITQTEDGEVYVVAGKEHSSIVHVDGLNTIRRIAASEIQVTPELLAKAGEYFVQRDVERQANQTSDTLKVALRAAAPVVDGKLDDWQNADWAKIDDKTSAALSIAGDRLYAAFRTQDKNLLDNSGEALPMLFKTGGALDLMIGTNPNASATRGGPVAGDVRVLVARADGKTMAAIYRPVVSGAKKPVPFSSPWRTITFDRVDDVSGEVQLANASRNEEIKQPNGKTQRLNWEEYEFSIPLAALGLTPQAGQTIKGDIGILRGNRGETTQRQYWRNKATGLVNDVPGEARLTPQLWGQWKFE